MARKSTARTAKPSKKVIDLDTKVKKKVSKTKVLTPRQVNRIRRRGRNYGAMQKNIVTLLKEKGQYQEVDSYLIERLLENMELADLSIREIRERGILIEMGQNGYLAKNPAILTYKESIKFIIEISKKLGMSVRDRAELGIGTEEEKDVF